MSGTTNRAGRRRSRLRWLGCALTALTALALSACAHSAVPPGSATTATAQHAGPAISATASASPPARAPSDIARECRGEAAVGGEPLRFDWEKTVARGPFAAINALAATLDGVLVAGGESREREQSEAFVAAFDADGHERYRVTLDQPRSTTRPPRARAVAVAATTSGDAYVVSTASHVDGSGTVALSLVDARGDLRFSVPVALSTRSEPSLVVEPNGDVIVAGFVPSGQEFTVFKQTQAGARVWTKTYALPCDTLRLVRVGQRLLLVGSLHGTGQFGATRLAQTEKVEFQCAGDPHPCEGPALSLLVAELGPTGEPLRARLLGPPSGRVSVSDVAVAGDAVLVTGEYQGPPSELGKVALCELEGGMPEPESRIFHELGGGPYCSCRLDRRDLFLLALDAEGEPRWAKTLALGVPNPRVRAGAKGEIRWVAEGPAVASASGPAVASASRPSADVSSQVSLWSVDAGGVVGTRQATAGSLSQMAAGPSAVYLSDQRVLRKASW